MSVGGQPSGQLIEAPRVTQASSRYKTDYLTCMQRLVCMQVNGKVMSHANQVLQITIDTDNLNNIDDGHAPLYIESGGELWKVGLCLTESGVCAIWMAPPWDSGESIDVYHGRTRCWFLPATVKGEALSRVLSDAATLQLLQRVYDGLKIDWDGSNHIGELNDDAEDASAELEQVLCKLQDECWSLMSADEFIAERELLEVWPAGQSLAKAARNVMAGAEQQDIFCGSLDEVEEALLQKLQSSIEDDDDFIPTPEQSAELED